VDWRSERLIVTPKDHPAGRAAIVACCLAAALASCGATDHDRAYSAARQSLDDGRASWARRKPSCLAYTYERTSFSDLVGDEAPITTVHVDGDVPAWREYSVLVPDAGVGDSWLEEGADVGSHANGFPADTVEGLYEECETLLKVARATDYSVVVTDGVPRTCRWFDGACAGAPCGNDLVDVLGFAMDPTTVTRGSSPDAGGD
jgi:hypothetical protein